MKQGVESIAEDDRVGDSRMGKSGLALREIGEGKTEGMRSSAE